MHSIESKAFKMELHIDPKRMNLVLNGSGFHFEFLALYSLMCQRDKPSGAYSLPNLLIYIPLKFMTTAKNFKGFQPNIFYIYHSIIPLNKPARVQNKQNSISENVSRSSKNRAFLP